MATFKNHWKLKNDFQAYQVFKLNYNVYVFVEWHYTKRDWILYNTITSGNVNFEVRPLHQPTRFIVVVLRVPAGIVRLHLHLQPFQRRQRQLDLSLGSSQDDLLVPVDGLIYDIAISRVWRDVKMFRLDGQQVTWSDPRFGDRPRRTGWGAFALEIIGFN